MRLFVDCDDTLILWHYQKAGDIWVVPSRDEGEGYDRNDALIAAVERFITNKNAQLVVWSGGGADYASHWARKFFDGKDFIALSKDIHIPRAEDICVDDVEIKVEARLFGPQAFVEWLTAFTA